MKGSIMMVQQLLNAMPPWLDNAEPAKRNLDLLYVLLCRKIRR